MSTACLACKAGFPAECYVPNDEGFSGCADVAASDSLDTLAEVNGGRAEKSQEKISDVLSTGRKRAARLWPIEDGMICEWAGLKNAGGGVSSIVGCLSNLATNIHHGPDKSVLNNERENIHRICTHCHNRWHSVNDEHYGVRPANGDPFLPTSGVALPHDAETRASAEDILNHEAQWYKRPARRPKEKE